MKKVVVVSTGGTIAMRYDPVRQGMVPAISGRELIEAVPPLKDVCPFEVVEFSNVPSFHMTPPLMQKLAETVETILAAPEVAGVVITHGTDTMEETAWFLDCYTASVKPVCLTAAMRSSSEISPDGPNNILCAVRTAAAETARDRGVLVVMNNEIHAARDVTKTDTGNVKTFASPAWGPLGVVDGDAVLFHRAPQRRRQLRPEKMVLRVPIIKMYTGIDSAWVEALLQQGIDGVVIESFGRGNIPETAVPGVQRLLDRGVPVVIASRVQSGRVLDVYAATGGGADLKKRGAILGGALSSQKARLTLMLALGITRDGKALQLMFEGE